MGQIKARYVAQIEADFEFEESESELSFDEIHDNVTNKITPDLQELLQDEFLAGISGKVIVTQMYADAWRSENED